MKYEWEDSVAVYEKCANDTKDDLNLKVVRNATKLILTDKGLRKSYWGTFTFVETNEEECLGDSKRIEEKIL